MTIFFLRFLLFSHFFSCGQMYRNINLIKFIHTTRFLANLDIFHTSQKFLGQVKRLLSRLFKKFFQFFIVRESLQNFRSNKLNVCCESLSLENKEYTKKRQVEIFLILSFGKRRVYEKAKTKFRSMLSGIKRK